MTGLIPSTSNISAVQLSPRVRSADPFSPTIIMFSVQRATASKAVVFALKSEYWTTLVGKWLKPALGNAL